MVFEVKYQNKTEVESFDLKTALLFIWYLNWILYNIEYQWRSWI